MKKTSTILLILVIVVSIALIAAIVKFFILPKQEEGQYPASTQAVENTAASSTKTGSDDISEPERNTVTEGLTAVETAMPEDSYIDLSGEGKDDVRIETVGPMQYKTPDSVPEFYTPVTVIGISDPMWAYQDKEGTVRLRTYGSRWKKVNNVNQEELTGFYDIEIVSPQNGRKHILVKSMADTEADSAAVAEADREGANPQIRLDERYHEKESNLYACITKSGTIEYRTFAAAGKDTYLYACDEKGSIARGSIPVVPEEEKYNLVEYTEDFTPETAQYNYPGLYTNSTVVLTVGN